MSKQQMKWGKTICLVTGASRGFGATMCKELSPHLGAGSLILGIARSAENLEATKEEVVKGNSEVKFVPIPLDLSTATSDELGTALQHAIEKDAEHSGFMTAFLVHNVGSLGDIVYLRDLLTLSPVKVYYDLNVSSVVVTNAVFLKLLKTHYADAKTYVINISSFCAVKEFKSWGLYCAGKAARDMLFKVLAAEEPEIRVLNYAPGPLDGEMQEIARTCTSDKDVREMFCNLHKNNQLVKFSSSVSKLLNILQQDTFISGDHIDYYDE